MLNANWIKSKKETGFACPVFRREFTVNKPVKSATLAASARGVYTANLNGQRLGDFILAPGWTVYEKRIQVQTYDITDIIKEENHLDICLAKGWYLGRITTRENLWGTPEKSVDSRESAVIAELCITYADGTREVIGTDESWRVAESPIRFCELYDGEIYDATFVPNFDDNAVIAENNDLRVLIPQQGEAVIENERIKPIAVIHTPKGETVLDFGQNLTGYPEITVTAKAGEEVELSFAEILDKDGNFYNKNYRSAKCMYRYICFEGTQSHKPALTFYGFRYIRIDKFPKGAFNPDNFTAIVLHSRLKRTGNIITSDPMLNQLFHNIIWGQKSNYLDIPTDCPQRDERLGWTGDAQVFVRTASYNFDVQRFFTKWLEDMRISQKDNGAVPCVIPNTENGAVGAAWGDAVTICPWQIYLTYGDKNILKSMLPAMRRWIDYITDITTTPYLWTGAWQYGDWLELTAPFGEYKGETRDDIIASAFYANSTNLLCKAGRIIGEDISRYEELYRNIVRTFKETYRDDFKTQTELVLALHFDLTDNKSALSKQLYDLIVSQGKKLQTGFVGTPYLLHVLSDNGYADLAYDLLLRKEFPSWLYPITKGATTMWEHWDGIMPNGDMWSEYMNSFNHYAYGAVADWMYGVCAGINTVESAPGFNKIIFRPIATDKLERFYAEIETVHGKVSSSWYHQDGAVRYEIVTPSPAIAVINGKEYKLTPGKYIF